MNSPSSSRIFRFIVPAVNKDTSLPALRSDRFLAEQFEGQFSRSRIKTMIEEGLIYKNGRILNEPASAAHPHDVYECTLPPPRPAMPRPQSIDLDILYEDNHLLVLNKPAGLVVHPAPGNEDGTLVNALLAHCGAHLPGIGGEQRPGIVHRLDKDTSGLMVIAKTDGALAALSHDFAQRDIERSYTALCWGIPSKTHGEIETQIGRSPQDRKKMAVLVKGGKYALTRYKVLQSYQNAASLIECRLATGRTHQIRVHLSHIGHPLIGDPTYLKRIPAVAKDLPPELKTQALDYPYQALHATTLGFTHPATQQKLSFSTPLPPLFEALRASFERFLL